MNSNMFQLDSFIGANPAVISGQVFSLAPTSTQFLAPGFGSSITAGAAYTNISLSWAPASTTAVTGCVVQLDSSPDNSTWTSAALFAATACTGSGTVTNQGTSALFWRIHVTALTGGPVALSFISTSFPTTGVGVISGGGLIKIGNSVGMLQTCTVNQVLQWSGTAWGCASTGSGTLTQVSPGTGITTSPNPITGVGTVSLNAALPNGETATTQTLGDASGLVASDQFVAQNVTASQFAGGTQGELCAFLGPLGCTPDPSAVYSSGYLGIPIDGIVTTDPCTQTLNAALQNPQAPIQMDIASSIASCSYDPTGGYNKNPINLQSSTLLAIPSIGTNVTVNIQSCAGPINCFTVGSTITGLAPITPPFPLYIGIGTTHPEISTVTSIVDATHVVVNNIVLTHAIGDAVSGHSTFNGTIFINCAAGQGSLGSGAGPGCIINPTTQWMPQVNSTEISGGGAFVQAALPTSPLRANVFGHHCWTNGSADDTGDVTDCHNAMASSFIYQQCSVGSACTGFSSAYSVTNANCAQITIPVGSDPNLGYIVGGEALNIINSSTLAINGLFWAINAGDPGNTCGSPSGYPKISGGLEKFLIWNPAGGASFTCTGAACGASLILAGENPWGVLGSRPSDRMAQPPNAGNVNIGTDGTNEKPLVFGVKFSNFGSILMDCYGCVAFQTISAQEKSGVLAPFDRSVWKTSMLGYSAWNGTQTQNSMAPQDFEDLCNITGGQTCANETSGGTSASGHAAVWMRGAWWQEAVKNWTINDIYWCGIMVDSATGSNSNLHIMGGHYQSGSTLSSLGGICVGTQSAASTVAIDSIESNTDQGQCAMLVIGGPIAAVSPTSGVGQFPCGSGSTLGNIVSLRSIAPGIGGNNVQARGITVGPVSTSGPSTGEQAGIVWNGQTGHMFTCTKAASYTFDLNGSQITEFSGCPTFPWQVDQGITIDHGGLLTLGSHLNQTATGKFAGSCAMAASTTCTFSIGTAFSGTPVTFVSIDGASTVPATANSAKCSVSGTTVTITAGISNSLTWDCLLIGNPN